MALLTASDSMADLAGCDLVIEAIFQDMAVKKELFTTLDDILKPDTILATNTSYLDIDEMAAVMSRTADVVGLHFFSPADLMKLLEIVHTQDSSEFGSHAGHRSGLWQDPRKTARGGTGGGGFHRQPDLRRLSSPRRIPG